MAELVVTTTSGNVRGELRGDVRVWKGIPYAAPPVGELRFRPPVPPVPWLGERAATQYGAVAAQSRDPKIALLSGISDKVSSGEDCLVLNVFAPLDTDPGAGQWPVMVWIHGGAFIMGSGTTPLYSGIPFAEQGIVVVTINYRLGLPGFLYLGELAKDRAEGNYALLDQIAALAWVRDNIAAFGGDPQAVTVMGESAGAISIAHLLGMPAARGLFQRAILESGGPPLVMPTKTEATQLATAVLSQLGVAPEQLPGVPIDYLLEVQDRLIRGLGLAAFAPYLDGVTLARPPLDDVVAGSAAAVSLLIGSNHDEWSFFEVFLGEVTVEPFKTLLPRRLGDAFEPVFDAYRNARPEKETQRIHRAWVDLIGDTVFRIPALRLADAQSVHAPVHVYRFDWRTPTFGNRLGAAHALELPFVWNRLDLPLSQILLGDSLLHAQSLATLMHMTWVAFIKTGDPNGAGLPAWPRYDVPRRATMLLDKVCHVVDDPGADTRAAWPTTLDS